MQYKSRRRAKICVRSATSLAYRTSSKAACNGRLISVRVNAQLVDARTDAQLWAQTYDRDLADVFAIQSEIAQAIADQLQAQLSPKDKEAIMEQPTKDLAAYDLYLQAKELLKVNPSQTKEKYIKAVQLLDQTVARDPAFFLAYCQLAFAHDADVLF